MLRDSEHLIDGTASNRKQQTLLWEKEKKQLCLLHVTDNGALIKIPANKSWPFGGLNKESLCAWWKQVVFVWLCVSLRKVLWACGGCFSQGTHDTLCVAKALLIFCHLCRNSNQTTDRNWLSKLIWTLHYYSFAEQQSRGCFSLNSISSQKKPWCRRAIASLTCALIKKRHNWDMTLSQMSCLSV